MSHLSFFFTSQERQADWLLSAYGPAASVPVPVLLDYLRAELATTAEAADAPVTPADAAALGLLPPGALPLAPQPLQPQQPPTAALDDGMDALPVDKHPRPSPGGRRGGGGGGAFGV